MPKDNLPNLAQIIYEAYPDSDLLPIDPLRDCRSLDDLLERVTTQDIGDSLLEFLVTEIVEGGEGTLDGAIRVVKRARKDVDAVLQALFRARAEHPKESPKAAHRARGPRPTDLGIWRCRDCRRVLYRSYKKVAEAGTPYCPACGRWMELA
jgi:rubrerythrin